MTGIAGALLLNAEWVAGAVVGAIAAGCLWLAWAFDVPGTLGWYERRVARAFATWNEQCDASWEDLDIARQHRREQVHVMPVPVGHTDDHRALDELIIKQDELTTRTDLTTGARVAELMGVASAIDALVTHINDTTTDDGARGYGARLRALRRAARADHARYQHEVHRQGELLLRRLGRLRPPARVVTEHTALVAAATHVVELTDRFTAVVATDDIASALHVAQELERAREKVHSAALATWSAGSEGQNAPL